MPAWTSGGPPSSARSRAPTCSTAEVARQVRAVMMHSEILANISLADDARSLAPARAKLFR